MNCKQGDLAIVVRSMAGNEGKVVTCIRYIGPVQGFIGQDYWEIDCNLVSDRGLVNKWARDSWMRPIRPNGVTEQEVTELYTPQEPVLERR